jgi:Tfp pilus assembly protein PilN
MIPATRAACRQVIKQQRKRIAELEEQLAQRDRRIAELVRMKRGRS